MTHACRRAAGLLLLALALPACSKAQLLDVAMASAPRHRPLGDMRVGPYQVLAGDMHCHVLPPDSPWHVSRDLEETARLARAEGLDFVVLTPHVPARFFLDPAMREWVRGTQRVLRARAEALEEAAPLLIPGMEYTDHRFGHVGLSFADVGDVLDDIRLDALTSKPALFFEQWRAHGGLATINHPVLRPIPNAVFMELRYDLSWRDFAADDGSAGQRAVFPEIRWISENADSIETFNTSVTHLRDQFIVGDHDRTFREGSHLADRVARARQRRITPVGGSDSHGSWLRATTFVLATERTPVAIRDAVLHGRSCVRGPEACTLEVRAGDGAFHAVGASLTTKTEERTVDVRVRTREGARASYLVNGSISASGGDGEIVRLTMPGHCVLVRAVVGESASAPVYVDCPWADRPALD